MRPDDAARPDAKPRSVWKTPTVRAVAMTKATRGPHGKARGGGVAIAEPAPPAAPATKLGFWFEWGFPLSARSD